jgi:hypothetical protein
MEDNRRSRNHRSSSTRRRLGCAACHLGAATGHHTAGAPQQLSLQQRLMAAATAPRGPGHGTSQLQSVRRSLDRIWLPLSESRVLYYCMDGGVECCK